MAALIIERKTPKLGQDVLASFPANGALPVAASTKIYEGALIALATVGANAGNVVQGQTAVGLVALGVAEKTVDNSTGTAGALTIVPRSGVFQFNNSATTDAIAAQHVGQLCYIADDNTVALTSAGGTRSIAGLIVAVDVTSPGQSQPVGVWVLVGPTAPLFAAQQGIAAFVKAAADGAAGTATAETAFARVSQPGNVSNVFYVPSAALTGDPTNNATILVQKRDGIGGAPVTVATLTTTVSWAAFVPVSLGTITNAALAPGNVLTLSISKGGTGVVVPAGELIVL